LLIHGSADPIVPLEQSTRFAERLAAVKASVELLVLPGPATASAAGLVARWANGPTPPWWITSGGSSHPVGSR
jgi:acetyl esterase/lipase